MSHSSESDQPPCTKSHQTVSLNDLPLSCPPRSNRIWDGHPRVFLPIEEVGEVVCPYCGTAYRLDNFVAPPAPLKILPEQKISAKIITPTDK